MRLNGKYFVLFSQFQVSDSVGDKSVSVSDPPKQPPHKRRRIIDASSITNVPVYSNKVSVSCLFNIRVIDGLKNIVDDLYHVLKYDCNNLDALEWMCCKVTLQTKVIQMLYYCVLGQQLLKSEANNLQKHQSHRYQNFRTTVTSE